MSGAFNVIPEPAFGSSAPLEWLSACNARLLQHCASLRRLGMYLSKVGLDSEARAALEALLHFFDDVLPLQHADEEEDLFPALLEAMAGSDALCIHEMAQGLTVEHREARRLWEQLRPVVSRVASGAAASLPLETIEKFIAVCHNAAAREQGELLPMADRLLADQQLDDMAASMRRRRAAQPPPSPAVPR